MAAILYKFYILSGFRRLFMVQIYHNMFSAKVHFFTDLSDQAPLAGDLRKKRTLPGEVFIDTYPVLMFQSFYLSRFSFTALFSLSRIVAISLTLT